MTSISDLLKLDAGSAIVHGNPIILTNADNVAGEILDVLSEHEYTVGETIEILNYAVFWLLYGASARQYKKVTDV